MNLHELASNLIVLKLCTSLTASITNIKITSKGARELCLGPFEAIKKWLIKATDFFAK